MKPLALFKVSLFVFLGPIFVNGQTGDRPDGMRFLPDVVGQFQALTDRPEALGLHTESSPNPSSCRHYQSVARVQGADGTPFLLMTRSGNLPEFGFSGTVCDDSPGETGNGHLVVFRMGSRAKNGERLRSNRLAKGVHLNFTPPNPDDKATIYFTIVDGGLVLGDGEGPAPARGYQHPGGMQVIGNVLAMAVEHPRPGGSEEECRAECTLVPTSAACERCLNYERAPNPTMVMFFDISNPEDPRFLSQYALVDGDGQQRQVAGTLGITPLADGHYLMAVTGGEHNPALWFYRSTTTDLTSPNLSWLYVDGWFADTIRPVFFQECAEDSIAVEGFVCLSPDEQYLEQDWPDGNDGHTHQTLQFLREQNIDGTLYLAGARGKFGSDTSTLDLYRVDCETPLCEPGRDVKLKRVVTRDVTPFPNTGGGRKIVSLAAASSFYVSPSGELILYGTEHDNDGPNDSVKAGEWRHKNVVREGSPTLLPTARVNGPFEVDEGSSVDLTGSATPPITKAWVQLFHATDLRSNFAVVDFADYQLDDFDDFSIFEFWSGPLPFPFNSHNKFKSLSWFAPSGCSMVAVDRESGDGEQTLTLNPGTTIPQEAPNLALVANDAGSDNMNERIDGVAFQPTCTQYYSTPFNLLWDLDLNGSYESAGESVPFNANVDGPSQISIPVQAQHPAGGLSGQATAMVSVKNVAPNITGLALVDPLGRTVGIDVPFALINVEYTVQGSFTDPGVQDHQTATLNLGNGAVPSSGFELFTDAFGGAMGQLQKRHVYTTPGTFSINLEVVDDDGGLATVAMPVRVASLTESLQWVLDDINSRLATATNSNVIRALRDARDSLAGDHTGLFRQRGALDYLKEGNFVGTLQKINDAIKALERAEAAGIGALDSLKYALGVTSEASAQKAYQRAVAHVGTPNAAEARQLERIRASIAIGHSRLAAGAYVAAVDEFKDAAARAACLEALLCINL